MGALPTFLLLTVLHLHSAVGPELAPPALAPFMAAERVRVFEHPELSMRVLEGEVDLPGSGWHKVSSDTEGSSAWTQVQFIPPRSDAPYLLSALQHSDADGVGEPFHVELRSSQTGEVRTVTIDPRSMESGDEDIFRRWASQRAQGWWHRARRAPGSVLSMWLARQHDLYGAEVPALSNDPLGAFRRARGNTTSIFNVLGGRAAIRETLQLEALELLGNAREEATIAIGDVPGVTVESHHYEEMLAGRPGSSVPLANLVPHDRFFVYFARPETLGGYLEGGVEFLHRTSSTFTSSHLEYDLVPKYFARLGLTVEAARMFLESGAVAEIAVVLPDLFVIDGTDVSLVMRVPNPRSLDPILRLLGVGDLGSGNIVEQSLPRGGSAFWARRGETLLLGTNRAEIARSLDLEDSDGAGSLGESAEFRYMLTKLPLEQSTLAYAYLSDPFIRRLVGPEVKIGQLRRMRARAELEQLSAGALLHRYDGHRESPSIARLAGLGYIPESIERGDYTLDRRGVARSKRYGTASEMTPLTRVEVQRVRPSEAEAYDRYRESYTAFWQQFFDPIAIRLDSPAPGELELNIFILPLIDSSIYNMVREMVEPSGPGRALPVPQISPEPVLLLSANVQEPAWKEMVDDFGDVVERLGISREILDQLDSTIHFAVQDGDPVVHFGSGDMLGAFGAGSSQLMRQRELFLLPIALSAFTRPCQFLIPLRDPERTLALLSQTQGIGTVDRDRDSSVDWTRVDKENRWILTSRFFDMITLRFGIAIDQGHLIISNIPWMERAEITGFDTHVLSSAALRVAPGAGEQQLAGLFTNAVEGERKAVFSSAAHLYPLLCTSGNSDVAAAQEWHAELFGFRPNQPGAGRWSWSAGEVTSSRYGNLWRPRQPAYSAGDRNFGVLRSLETLNVSVQLEDAGLRSRFRAKLRREP